MDIKNGYNIKSQLLKINNDFQIYQWLKKIVPVLMGIFIFFNPFPHTTSIKEICFYLSVVIFSLLIIFKKNDFSFKIPFMLSFGLFVCWVFIGLFFALDKNNSIHDFYAHLLKYIVLYYILINYFSTKKHLTILSWIIISSSTIFAVGAMIYFYFILGNPLSARLGGPNFVQTPVGVIGVMTVFAMILSLNNLLNETTRYWKIILIICFFLQFILLVLAQTRSSFIPFCLAVVILFINYKKALIALFGILLMVVSFIPLKTRLVSYSHPLIALRVGINYHTYEIIKDYPIIGIGFGMETFKNALDLKTEVRCRWFRFIFLHYICFFQNVLGHYKIWKRRFCKKLESLPCRCSFFFFIYRIFSPGFQSHARNFSLFDVFHVNDCVAF
jgi:hypothetical protein